MKDKTHIILMILLPIFGLSFEVASAQGVNWSKLKQEIRDEFPEVSQLSVDSLAAWMETDEDILVLDTRKEKEYLVSHLPGAVFVGPKLKKLPKDLSLNQKIVLYCSVGYRSSKAGKKLMEKGYTNIYNLEGSIFEWANEGHEIFVQEKRVHKVHPFNSLWGRYLDRQFH